LHLGGEPLPFAYFQIVDVVFERINGTGYRKADIPQITLMAIPSQGLVYSQIGLVVIDEAKQASLFGTDRYI
jgi:hypothetical protein